MPERRRASRCSLVLAAASIAASAVAVASAAGCARPLFSPDEERSQYDRFDAVRNQQAPPYIEDAFGKRRPNLRGRLGTRD